MKKLYKLFGIIAIVALIGFALAGCDNGNTDDDPSRPGELSEDATYKDADAKLDEIIDYCGDTAELSTVKSSATLYKDAISSDGWDSQKDAAISFINSLIQAIEVFEDAA